MRNIEDGVLVAFVISKSLSLAELIVADIASIYIGLKCDDQYTRGKRELSRLAYWVRTLCKRGQSRVRLIQEDASGR